MVIADIEFKIQNGARSARKKLRLRKVMEHIGESMQANDMSNRMLNRNEMEIAQLKVELHDAHARWLIALAKPIQDQEEIMACFDKKNDLELRIVELGGTLP